MLDVEFPTRQRTDVMPSLNHSYICLEIIKQLVDNGSFHPLPELDIENGLTPDISVFFKRTD